MLKRNKITADFCVVGGGLAGICSAIAAARAGVKVVLMHERPVLGGNASSEIRMWICGARGENNRETGIIEEIILENYYRNPTKNYYLWDTVLYDFVMREKNITLLLNCTCMDAEIEKGNFGDGRDVKITKVTGYQLTTQMFYDIEATNYADCSGDSILAPLTGAEFRIGRESKDEFGEKTYVEQADNLTMGMNCLIQGRETERKIKFTPPDWSTKLTDKDFENRTLNLDSENENFWYLELGGNRDTIHQTEEIKEELIPLALGTWDYIKNSGKYNADKWELEFLGFLPGKRESRRMTGEYIITANDLLSDEKFHDTVAYGGWPVDDHYPDGFYTKGRPNTNILPPAPYCIPYRALYSKNVSNLFFAGRNISMTHMAMSSVRVMATCAVIGEAVGVAAAIASKYNLTPHGVYREKLELLQNTLMDEDCFLPTKKRVVSEICTNTELKNGNEYTKNGEDRPNQVYGNHLCGTEVQNGTMIEYDFKKPEHVNKIHITFDSDLNRLTLPGEMCERTHCMRANIRLNSPQFYMPKTLCRSFKLIVMTDNGEEILLNVNNNRKRSYSVDVGYEVNAIKLLPLSNWGESEKTTVFSFDFA